jgi:transposase
MTQARRSRASSKCHIAVDTQGLPHAIAVTTADVTDHKGTLQAMRRCKTSLGKVQSVLADAGYVGKPFALSVQEILGETVTGQTTKRSELHKFAVIPKVGWSSARSPGSRSAAGCGKTTSATSTSLQFIHLTFLALLLRRS